MVALKRFMLRIRQFALNIILFDLNPNSSHCQRCLYTSSHPLNLTFDSDGECSGCRVHEEKYQLDWEHRFDKLKKLVEPYRSKSGMNYDCIVPVSRARDRYFIAHVVKKNWFEPLIGHLQQTV